MAKYHISENGEAKPCNAKIKCPLGESMPHFSNKEDAQKYFENIMKPLPKKTDEEKIFLKRLANDNIDTVIAVNDSSISLFLNDDKLDYFDQVQEQQIAQGNSQKIADFMTDFTDGESDYEDGLIELETIEYNPIGKELNNHYANTFQTKNPLTNKVEDYVVDFSYSEINPNADYPYVDSLENWKKDLDRISFTGVEEYIPPPPDPRTFDLPKFQPGENNPLLDKAVLSDAQKNTNGTETRFLKVDEVKVAAIHYLIEDDALPHIHSLETRSEYRNQGYMKKLLKDMANEYNVDRIYSSSKFTPHGYNFTKHLTKPRNGEVASIEHGNFTDEKPFSFIHDWVEGTMK